MGVKDVKNISTDLGQACSLLIDYYEAKREYLEIISNSNMGYVYYEILNNFDYVHDNNSMIKFIKDIMNKDADNDYFKSSYKLFENKDIDFNTFARYNLKISAKYTALFLYLEKTIFNNQQPLFHGTNLSNLINILEKQELLSNQDIFSKEYQQLYFSTNLILPLSVPVSVHSIEYFKGFAIIVPNDLSPIYQKIQINGEYYYTDQHPELEINQNDCTDLFVKQNLKLSDIRRIYILPSDKKRLLGIYQNVYNESYDPLFHSYVSEKSTMYRGNYFFQNTFRYIPLENFDICQL